MRLLTAEWSLQARFEDVKTQLEDSLGEPVEADEMLWRWESESGISDRTVELDRKKNRVNLAVRVPDALRYVLYILTGVLVVGVLSDTLVMVDVGVAASMLLVFVFKQHTEPPRHEDLELSSLRLSWYYFGSIALAILFVFPSSLGSSGIFQIIYLGVAAFILLEHFAQGSIPIDSEYLPDPGRSQSHLHIPILGLVAPVLAYAIFNIFNLLRLSSVPYRITVPVVSAAGVLITWGYAIACRDALDRVRFDRNAAYSSRGIQFFTLLLYLVANAVSLIMLVIWVDLLSFGVRGEALLQNLGSQGVELLSGVYAGLDSTLAMLPVLPPRVYSMLFLTVNFLPVLLLLGLWLVFLTTHSASKFQLLLEGRELSLESVDEGSAKVVCVDVGRPIVTPLTLFFGLKKYVVIDESVKKKLTEHDEDELNAVLSHELYHLRRQETAAQLFSSLVSVLAFGGKNALLAFYNYPKIEEEADEHAVEKWGKTNLITALRKLEDLQAEAEFENSIQDTIGFPGFISLQDTPSDAEDTEGHEVKSEETPAKRNRFSLLKEELTAPYRLFYGPVLYDEAHRPIDERIQAISELV